MDDFDRCVAIVVALEGGDKVVVDSGGVTKYGISSRAHPTVDVRNLTLEQAKEIYRTEYWEETGCDGEGWPMNLVIFDCAVNQGVGEAKRVAAEALDYVEALFMRVVKYSDVAEKNHSLRQYFRGWIGRVVEIWHRASDAKPTG
jgi:hypothetical protein